MGDHLKAHVWKLQDVSVDNEDGESQEGYGSPGLSPINTFTLQETLFVEQLTSIDERVRLQVSNFECSYDVIVGSVTSSRNANLHSTVRPFVRPFLELSIFIYLVRSSEMLSLNSLSAL